MEMDEDIKEAIIMMLKAGEHKNISLKMICEILKIIPWFSIGLKTKTPKKNPKNKNKKNGKKILKIKQYNSYIL